MNQFILTFYIVNSLIQLKIKTKYQEHIIETKKAAVFHIIGILRIKIVLLHS